MKKLLRYAISIFCIVFVLGCSVYKGVYAFKIYFSKIEPSQEYSSQLKAPSSADVKTNNKNYFPSWLEDVKRYAAIPVEHPIFNYYYWTGDNSGGSDLNLITDANGNSYYVLPRSEKIEASDTSQTPWDFLPTSWYSGDSDDLGFKYLVNSDGTKSDWKKIDDDSYVLNKSEFMNMILSSCSSPYFGPQSNVCILNLDYNNNYITRFGLSRQCYYEDIVNDKTRYNFEGGFTWISPGATPNGINFATSLCYNPSYNVTFDKGAASGVTGSCPDYLYPSGLKVYLPTYKSYKGSLADKETFKRAGYKALGWEVKDAVGNPVAVIGDFNGYASGEAPSSIYFTMPNSDVTVTMLWDKIYNLSYSSGCSDETSHYRYYNEEYCKGEEVTLKPNHYSRPPEAAYIFSRWLVTDADGNEITVTNDKFIMPESDVSIIALWDKTYTITYQAGSSDVTGSMPSVSVVAGSEYTLDKNKFKKKAFYFDGWSVTDVAGNSISVSSDNKITMPFKNLIATPKWATASEINITVELYRIDESLPYMYELYKSIDEIIYEGEDYDAASVISEHPEWIIDTDLTDDSFRYIENASTDDEGSVLKLFFSVETCEVLVRYFRDTSNYSYSTFIGSAYNFSYEEEAASIKACVGDNFSLTDIYNYLEESTSYEIFKGVSVAGVRNFPNGTFDESDVDIVTSIEDGRRNIYINKVPGCKNIIIDITYSTDPSDSSLVPVQVTSYIEPEDNVGCDISEYTLYKDEEVYVMPGSFIDCDSFGDIDEPDSDWRHLDNLTRKKNLEPDYEMYARVNPLDNRYVVYKDYSINWFDPCYTREDSEDPEHNYVVVYYRIKRGYIHFDPGCTDATGSMDDVEFQYDASGGPEFFDPWDAPVNQYERSGYEFVGWNCHPFKDNPDDDGVYYYDDGSWEMNYDVWNLYDPLDPINSMSFTVEALWNKLTVYVNYSVEHYQMNLERTGYDLVKSVDPVTVEEGTSIDIAPEDYEGFKYNSIISECSDSSLIEDKVFKLYYDRINNYKITFDKGAVDASGTMEDVTGKFFGEEISLPECEYNYLGYDFVKWNVKTVGGESVTVSDNKFSMPASNVLVTATWERGRCTYTVEYYKMTVDCSDYTLVNTTDPVKVDAGEAVSISPATIEGFNLNTALSDYSTPGLYEKEYTFRVIYDRINTYKVTFDKGADSADGIMEDLTNLSFEQEITLPACDFTNPGYEFKEFTVATTDGTEVTVSDGKFNMPASDVVITASWEKGKTQYYVEYYQMNLAGDDYDLVEADTLGPVVVDTESAVTISPLDYAGFTLNTSKSELSDDKFTDYDHVFKVYYDRINTYKVTFNKGADTAKGTMSGLSDLTFGQEITLPACDFTNPGYEFKEFTVATTDGTEVTVSGGKFNMPASDVVITATWTKGKTQYYVEFYQMNLAGDDYDLVEADTLGPVVVDTESKVTISPLDYAGFTLNTSKSELSDDKFTDYDHVFKVYYDRINTYKATFNKGADTAEGTMTELSDLSFGQEITLPACGFTNAGYDFKEFTVATTDGTKVSVSDGKFNMPASDVVITATWTKGKIQYYVEFYQMNLAGDDYDLVEADTLGPVEVDTESAVTISPLDYAGFTLNTSKSELSDNKFTDNNHVFKVYYDRINTYKVTFDKGADTAEGTMAELSDLSFGQEITLPACDFTNPGYDFKEFTVATTDGTEVSVSGGKFNMPASDVVITATWTKGKTQYYVEFYQMNLAGDDYDLVEADTLGPVVVDTESAVVISPLDYAGFTLNTSKSELSDDKFTDYDHVFKVYYDRIKTYKATFNKGADTADGTMTELSDLSFGQEITLPACGFTNPGYEFKEFTVATTDGTKVSVSGGKFNMPASDVVITATWEKGKTQYYVEFYQMNLAGNDYDKVEADTLGPVVVDTESAVVISPLDYAGFTLNTSKSELSDDKFTDYDHVFKVYYDRIKTYKLTFNKGADTAKGSMSGLNDLSFGQEITLPACDFTNPGYEFKEFTVATTDGTKVTVSGGKFNMPASDVVITATWTKGKTQYYVEFYQMNLAGDDYDLVKADTLGPVVVDTESAVVISPLDYPGFTLNTSKSELSDDKFTDYDHVFKVYYDRINTYKATFNKGAVDAEGTMSDISNLSFGQEVTIPANQYNYAGFDFVRFDVAKAVGGEAVTVKDGKFIMPACDVVITAIWSAGKDYTYNIEYYQMKLDRSGYVKIDESLNNVIAPMSTINIIPKTYEGFTLNEGLSEYVDNKFTRDGHTFKLYYDRVNTYTVKYSKGDSDASGTINDISNCSFGQTITITSEKYSSDKYVFKGWQVVRDDTKAIIKTNSSAKFTMPGSNVTITALWEVAKTKYKLIHKLMNTDGTTYQEKIIETKEVPYFSKLEFSAKSYEGFTLDNTLSSALTIDSVETANPVITLYYTRNKYELKYIGGAPDVSGTMTNRNDCYYNSSIKLDDNLFTREGYKFNGFEVTRDSDGAKLVLKNGVFTMPASNVTVKALWTTAKYSYTRKHYIKKIDDSGYELFKEEKLTAEYGANVSISPLDDNGLIYTPIPDEVKTGVVKDNSTALKLYYDRNKFMIVYDKVNENAEGLMSYTEHYYLEEVSITKCGFNLEDSFLEGWHIEKFDSIRDAHLLEEELVKSGEVKSPIENVVSYSLGAVNEVASLLTKDASSINVVISPSGTFKMPAYDITARVVWKDTRTASGGEIYTVDTSDNQLIEFYAGLFIFCVLILVFMGIQSRSSRKKRYYYYKRG